MEVPQIKEIRPSAELDETRAQNEIKASEPRKRKCAYNKEMTCQAPDCKMAICDKCPYGYSYSFSATLNDVFKKIVGMAIFLAKSDDVLRDVLRLVAKGDAEILKNGKEELEELEVRGAGEAGGGKEGGEMVDGGEVRPIIEKVNMADIKIETTSISSQMAGTISRKVADISEALGPRLNSGQANPNGPEKPLV